MLIKTGDVQILNIVEYDDIDLEDKQKIMSLSEDNKNTEPEEKEDK